MDKERRMIPFVLLAISLGFIILATAIITENITLSYLSSLIISVTGIYLLTNGLLAIDNWMIKSLAVIMLGVGVYVMIMASYETLSVEDN